MKVLFVISFLVISSVTQIPQYVFSVDYDKNLSKSKGNEVGTNLRQKFKKSANLKLN